MIALQVHNTAETDFISKPLMLRVFGLFVSRLTKKYTPRFGCHEEIFYPNAIIFFRKMRRYDFDFKFNHFGCKLLEQWF